MEITEVQVKLIGNGDERLKASCTLVVDGEFVIRDVKIIDGTSGLFVAMPSRKLTDHCPRCGTKNHLRAAYCNGCGAKLDEDRGNQRGGAQQMHVEIAHPINSNCRQRLHERVITAYEDARAARAANSDPASSDRTAAPGASAKPVASQPPTGAHDPESNPAPRDSVATNDDFGAGLV
jgi:stage V sporulation protein G